LTATNIVWQEDTLGRDRRWSSLRQQGATIWLTGLPGAGKSTVAAAVEARLVQAGRFAYRLDGDNLRHGVCSDLGFSPQDRAENVRRIGEVARLFADSGAVALVAVVSPYEADRQIVRQMHFDDGLAFVEVFVDTSRDECARRDPKGLYARQATGDICGLTGVDSPYEAPPAPDVLLNESMTIDVAADAVLNALASSFH
jgi:adenylyl-sulfate kinase